MWKHPSINEIKRLKMKYVDIFDQVQELVNEWDPVGLIGGGAPDDEYDCITIQLIDLLKQGANQAEIFEYIIHELDDHFGMGIKAIDNEYKESFIYKQTEFSNLLFEWYKRYETSNAVQIDHSLYLPQTILNVVGEITNITPINEGRHYQTVHKLETHSGKYIIKIKSREYPGSLFDEVERLKWMQGKLPVPKVISYEEEEGKEYLLMTYIDGCVASKYQPKDGEKSMGFILGEALRKLHDVKIDGCPFKQFSPDNLTAMVRKNILEHMDEVNEVVRTSFPDHTLEQLMDFLKSNKATNDQLTFTHGDYGSGNVMIHNGDLNAFLDVGEAGISDPYLDIYYMIKSLTVYSARQEEVSEFMNGYGIDVLDNYKMKFHQIMDTLLL
ncbi:phosphotransferase [Paenibacillus sp. EC2-1]|uniref:phosphotransferase n=1 Tax=Paenibacillus sp. EC2-1 TaxID=3388665 RepID=UPI003BEEF5C0